ncbi:hypothetical protein WHX56_21685 [Achromobacter veterisilvae]|uniref:Caspase family p20 domain-containing protein n=1 Tax=Achromobacter veterisilvae TaxID=2069367 RepID=A0ABZ2RW68_9BURK
MDRAIVLIGVSRTQGNPGRLEAVESAVDRMEQWAREQGIPEDRIARITDGEDDPVSVDQIYRSIQRFIDLDSLEQLIVYFSGHGSAQGLYEFWHLSDAPGNPNAAVNVAVSVGLAEEGRIPHVVLISDACRTIAKDVPQSKIHGGSIFPSFDQQDPVQPVDVFYATRRGAPALELPTLVGANEVYQAVYTEVLCNVLGGSEPRLVDNGFIRPRPLKEALKILVPDDLLRRGMHVLTNQDPDARITSGEDAWVARFDLSMPHGLPRAPRPGPGPLGNGDGPESEAWQPEDGMPPPIPPSTPPSTPPPLSSGGLVDYLVRHPADSAGLELQVSRALSDTASRLLNSVIRSALAEAPELREPGFIVRGRDVRRVVCREYGGRIGRRAGVYQPAPGGPTESYTAWEFPLLSKPEQALLVFGDGSGMLLPVFEGCAGILEFDAQGGFALRYDPLDARADAEDLRELRWLRAAVAEGARQCVLELDPASAGVLDDRMRNLRFLDPVLALHAAYAYREIGETGRIRALQDYLYQNLGVRLFDLAFLSRDLLWETYAPSDFMPATPLLSAGWILMDLLGRALPHELRALRQHDTGELWAHYTPAGVRALEAWLEPATGSAELYEMQAPRA